jgi:hypothetical protein
MLFDRPSPPFRSHKIEPKINLLWAILYAMMNFDTIILEE